MTQEEKELLIKDLCTRLPYGIKCKLSADGVSLVEDLQLAGLSQFLYGRLDVIPYLRPMSSMTEEEYNNIDWEGCRHIIYYDENGFCFVKIDSFTIPILDYLNARHFDYHGLIEKGLAIDCTNLNIY